MKYFVIFLIFASFIVLLPQAFADCISLPCDDANIKLGEPNYRLVDFSYQNKVGEPITFVLEKTSTNSCNSYIATITNEQGKVVWVQQKDARCSADADSALVTSQIKLGYEEENPIIMQESSRYLLKVQIDDGSIQREFVARENFSGISLDRTVYPVPWDSISQIENINGSLFRIIGPFTLRAQSNDTISLGGVEFSYPYFPVPPIPGGVQTVNISFQDGIEEKIGTVGPPNPFLKFTEHEDPKAGVRRNSDGTFDYLLSITNQSISPLKQFTLGIPIAQIQCRDDLILIQKRNGLPACVTSETKQKLIERGWVKSDTTNGIDFSKYTEEDVAAHLLTQNQIKYVPDKLVVTGGPAIRGDPRCGAAIDLNATTHWFGIDSISNPQKMTLFSENPNPCQVNTGSCFCNTQMELTALILDKLSYFSPEEEERVANTLIDYLIKENINRTPKFMIGKFNINYTDQSAVGYCGELWGYNTIDYFDGAIVNDQVMDYGLERELSPLCAIDEDAKWWE